MSVRPQASVACASSAASGLVLGAARCVLVGLRSCWVATVTTDVTSSPTSNRDTSTLGRSRGTTPGKRPSVAATAAGSVGDGEGDQWGRWLLGRLGGADGRAVAEELDGVLAPHMMVVLEVYADDSRSAVALTFGLHPAHREFARFVHRLRVLRHLHVLPDLAQALHH